MASASDRQGCCPLPLQAAGTWQGLPQWGFLACSQGLLSLGKIKGFLNTVVVLLYPSPSLLPDPTILPSSLDMRKK